MCLWYSDSTIGKEVAIILNDLLTMLCSFLYSTDCTTETNLDEVSMLSIMAVYKTEGGAYTRCQVPFEKEFRIPVVTHKLTMPPILCGTGPDLNTLFFCWQFSVYSASPLLSPGSTMIKQTS